MERKLTDKQVDELVKTSCADSTYLLLYEFGHIADANYVSDKYLKGLKFKEVER